MVVGRHLHARRRVEDRCTPPTSFICRSASKPRSTLQSNDVIHSFWVPNLAGKQDLIPGRDDRHPAASDEDRPLPRPVRRILRHRSTRNMALVVTVESRADFVRWWQQQLRPAAAPATPLELAGYRYVTTRAVQRVPQYRGHAGRRPGRPGPHPSRQPPDDRAPGTLPMNSGQPLRLGRRSAVAKARQQDADHRPRAERAARGRRLSREAQMTSAAPKAAQERQATERVLRDGPDAHRAGARRTGSSAPGRRPHGLHRLARARSITRRSAAATSSPRCVFLALGGAAGAAHAAAADVPGQRPDRAAARSTRSSRCTARR